jgi:uncharacterized RDD family membrane protein YckC
LEKETYTIVVNGKPQGPYTLAQLKDLDFKPATFVKTPGMIDYKEAHELPELRSFFGFRFEQVVPQYFASFDQRVVADIIDYLMVLIGYLLLMAVIYLVVSLNVFRATAIILVIFVPLGRLIYGGIAEASTKQATVGKRLMDIKVTDINGNRLLLSHSMGRNFSKIITNLTLGLGYLYCFLNKKQQCLHDVIAGSLVVKDRLL